jgi:hypothetical protein
MVPQNVNRVRLADVNCPRRKISEPPVRYGLLLRMVGRTTEARVVFNELLLQMKRAPKYLRDAQAEWLAIAEKQLSA